MYLLCWISSHLIEGVLKGAREYLSIMARYNKPYAELKEARYGRFIDKISSLYG